MRVLIVSQYFRPEVGATQNRMASFVDGLGARGYQVTVVCEQPNHPRGVFQEGYGHRPVIVSREEGVRVVRLWVATSPRKSTPRRLAFYGTFGVGAALAISTLPAFDVALITSPPLPGALAAAVAVRARRRPYVLDVRDLWPAAAQALGELDNDALRRMFELAERRAYRSAAAVTATTAGFCRHIDLHSGRRVSVHLPNGALDELYARQWPDPGAGAFVVGYVGNLGIAQGFEVVLGAAEQLRGQLVRFRLVGEGPLRGWLETEIRRRRLDAVTLEHGVPLTQVGQVLASCHALLVPLGGHPKLADFIPSKLYDAMAVGRPVLLAARGEAAAIVAGERCGLSIEPEDGEALAKAALRLHQDRDEARAMGRRGKLAAVRYLRSTQVTRLEEVLSAAVSRS